MIPSGGGIGGPGGLGHLRQELFGKLDANGPFSDIQAASAFQNSLAAYSSTLNPFIPAYRDQATGLVLETKNSADTAVWKVGWFDGTTAAFNPATMPTPR